MSVQEAPRFATKFDLPTKTDPIDGRVVDRVREAELPAAVTELVDGYEEVFGDRDRFLWQWIHSLFPAFEVPSVAARHVEAARTQKTLLTIFVTVVDDLVESRGDLETFDEARRIPFRPDHVDCEREGVDTATLEYLKKLWADLEARMRESPRYDEFVDLFEYDLRQTLNAMDYGRLVNENLHISNMKGNEHYRPHNMCMFPYANIDLMHSPAFEREDLSVLRETLWDLQRMARIGNDLTTWEREIDEEDFSATIMAYALRNADITTEQLRNSSSEAEEIIASVREACLEEQFVNAWWNRYEEVQERSPTAESFDIDAVIQGMETVMQYHLASQGLK